MYLGPLVAPQQVLHISPLRDHPREKDGGAGAGHIILQYKFLTV